MIERRIFDTELRAAERDGRTVFEGYASVFNLWSDDLGGFRERVLVGAFDQVLGDDVRGLFNHDYNLILGRTASGTLRLSSDSRGLHYEIDPPDTQYARDLQVSIERGDVSQSSFAFRAGDDKWWEDKAVVYRELITVERLYDVSPVTFPAYAGATAGVAARSLDSVIDAFVAELEIRSRAGQALDELMNRLQQLRAAAAQQGAGAGDDGDSVPLERTNQLRRRLEIAQAQIL